jgi:inhibitor of KinA sporulation pathway (predicted exonuclease)
MAHINMLEDVIIKKDFDNLSTVLVDLLNVIPKKEVNNGQNQSFVLEDFEKFLMKLLTHNVLPTREERFAVANFLHKIHSRREAIAVMTGEIDMEEIKKTSEGLGKRMAIPETEPFGIALSKR